jgi:glutamate dehydrogenase
MVVSATRIEDIVAQHLFGELPQGETARISDADKAALVRLASLHLKESRSAPFGNIRLFDVTLEGGGARRDVTVLSILNIDKPFLLDSTLSEIVDQGYETSFVSHPIVNIERDGQGQFDSVRAQPSQTSRRESLIHIHMERIDDEAARTRLVEMLTRVYADVAVAVADWPTMKIQIAEAAQAYRNAPPKLPADEVAEAVAFLEWIAADNFTVLGMREYRFKDGNIAGEPVEGSGLGILRDPNMRVLRRGKDLAVMTPEIRLFLEQPKALIITKGNVKSRVHRRVHLDYLGLKLFHANGTLEGELRIVGLFTSNAYTGSTSAIPYLRLKVARVAAHAGFESQSYSGRALVNVLESYPRDELFQVDEETLYRNALAILSLSERPRICALPRVDEFDRFVSILVYIPKDRYDTDVRRRVAEFLAGQYQGRVSAAYPAYPEGPLSRTHVIIGRDEGKTPHVEREVLEDGISAIVRTWADNLKKALRENPKARQLGTRYANAFSAAYREAFSATDSLSDITIIEKLSSERTRAVVLYRREGDAAHRVNLKVFARGAALPLSERVPLLEALGFRVLNERTYHVVPVNSDEDGRIWLHDTALERASGKAIDRETLGGPVEAALLATFRGLAENDGFNALVLEAGLGWRDVAVIRALGRYLRQIRIPYGQDYLAATLARHAEIAADLVALFYARFDPRLQGDRETAQQEVKAAIETKLAGVTSLDDDRILRRFMNLIEAALRTNFFQMDTDGLARPTIALKFACAKIDGLPLPRPLYEIFVYSPRIEGVHLRFGKVARGGLRWSDRPQDFRTEILGLVKAQQVKNAVIVPVGAKGGFVPKRLPSASDRAAWLEEGTESYRIFIRSLLQLTDNIDGDNVAPPTDTVRHDENDPYLVVAADKGTATFSDTANALSLEKGHWLGDAFASGGSQGYDHKKMGITARGGWEAVKRHFREIDIDIQKTPFTVAGVGDMSGDVFGNGMLLSRAILLVAAFDHRDIFLDPAPDPERSFAERQRLFALPRSSWNDYDKALISKGGGIFSRSLKAIPLSSEVQVRLGLDKSEASPAEVMQAILKMQVDLLWFGGIGTYIRACDESDEQVGDRANDTIRITGTQLQAKVIGEGANLGLTQKGRIEAARVGVRLNSDAIDNSAGVNTSDVEVNIKIALKTPESEGRLDEAARNALLADMTEEVADLVLRNNYLQTLSLSLSQQRGLADLGFARRLMQSLEEAGRLDRDVEYLPSDGVLTERQRKGESLTRPELAVLLAYAKLSLHDELLASSVPDDPYLAKELERYFPKPLRERFPETIAHHRLRREIIATQLSNAILNRGGATFITRIKDQTGAESSAIALAYAATRDSFGLLDLNTTIDALDARVNGTLQLQLYALLQDVLMSRLVWFLRNTDLKEGLESLVSRYGQGMRQVSAALDASLSGAQREALAQEAARLIALGTPQELAARFAILPALMAGTDITWVSERSDRPIADIAAIHFAVEDAFRLNALTKAAAEVSVSDYYDRLALDRAIDGIANAHRRLTREIAARSESGTEAVSRWMQERHSEVARIRSAVEAIAASGLTLSKLTVASSLLGDLALG